VRCGTSRLTERCKHLNSTTSKGKPNANLAHSYPSRDGRIDDLVNAKRIEWYRDETQPGNPWASVNDVESDAITCETIVYTRLIQN
jgi:hypothetical protein